ncbi:pyridoxal phosphate-dependent aminotransferase [Pedobacter sp. KBW01]|uniref:DegT/DnrJ/EryC1/StrS family aminotransferase n=1 Tax=Pedobacter sp. KBW01 TaxID=2153364 RepID=UPI000F59C409|nr:DegT/DnrJ/EryC1/StrS family aminotransferase [Pedobacter sp. KBW01]RQO65711.1 pyridoxal phosphate-dependent aminotransferase [Pedobacter sp. KBW01]
MKNRIWLSSPHMGGTEQKYVNEAFETNWIAPLGPNVDGFEGDLCHYTGSKYAAALSSGTGAIHLALVMLGVEPGDEVICQSMTFAASANPIAYVGATPIFVDSERDTWNMCPDLLRECIVDRLAKGKKPKAIIPVHLYGMPAKMIEIMEIANEFEIPVIEDAAEALGSNIEGKKMGTFGLFGILSFNGNKIITTSGGGALISDSEEYINEARFLATQARDKAHHYEHSKIGYNYRMSNICAGIGRGQMEVLNDRVEKRRSNFEYYRKSLAGNENISFLEEPKEFYSNRWLSTIYVDRSDSNFSKKDIYTSLLLENIESRPLWKPMHLQPVFKDAPYYGNGVSEDLFKNGLCLPSGSNLEDTDLFKVIEVIKSINY